MVLAMIALALVLVCVLGLLVCTIYRLVAVEQRLASEQSDQARMHAVLWERMQVLENAQAPEVRRALAKLATP